MPKEKQQVRTQSRRAASKEALKQMHLLLGDGRKYEISSDDDDVIEVEVQPPKKKYKLSHRKSSDGNDRNVLVLKSYNEDPFDLDVVVEELTPAQKQRYDQFKKETKEVDSKIEKLLGAPNTEVVYNGIYTTAVEISEQIQTILSNASTPVPSTQYLQPKATPISAPAPSSSVTQPVPSQSIVLQQQPSSNNSLQQSYQLVMNPRLGVIVGAVSASTPSPNTPPLQIYPQKVTLSTPTTTSNDQAMKTRRGTLLRQVPNIQKGLIQNNKGGKALQVKTNIVPKSVPVKVAKNTPKPILPMKGRLPNPAVLRPAEGTVEGGLTVGPKGSKSIDLTDETRSIAADSREVSFNKLQGRTYPSLVVVARPHLRIKASLTSDREKLDAKVKSVLMYPPTKFTEWLIQQGLVRSDQKCTLHPNNSLKLGMYSDVSKFPYSGGYVWISECCPQRFVSVFSGSLFEGSQHPPMAILKLLYHWCCQTIVQNVTQWVKVDNLYVKGMYTWLRAVCSVALHTHMKQMGGPGVKVQVGVISLGTTSQDGNKREVKVEVLGVLETTTRLIRLRAVEPLSDGERNYKKRFNKILEPVFSWVHPASHIITDLTVDKATLHQMGFLNVTQSTTTDYVNSNRTIMEYLRRIVPRMFQNTLSLLSRQIIQQFLDELVWREWYGTTVLQCFDNMVQHLSEQTRFDTEQSLVMRLSKVSANPFKNWAIRVATTTATTAQSKLDSTAPKRYSRQRKSNQQTLEVARPAKSTSPDVPEQLVPLENYYYGTLTPSHEVRSKGTINLKCPFCKLTFSTNITLMNHFFKHAHNVSNDAQLCKYCLTIVPTGNDLLKHIGTSHPDETKFDNGFVCLICESHFKNPFILGKHMSREHCPSELPYMCGTCSFRCSNHKQAIDHFYQQHDYGNTIQCPFCLKSTTIYCGGRKISQNMNFFIQHLQKHQEKQLAKRCGKCTLWFIQKDLLKEHQTKMHVSQRGKTGLVPCFAPRNGVMVPKSKTDKCPDDGKIINFSTLHFNVGKNLLCKECDKPLSAPKHFTAFESCQYSNCQYSTCCSNAMQQHLIKCKSLHADIPAEKLPFEMFCICGYRDIFGNQMAKHLAKCERKSAYPSKQAAKSATVTQCMLDVLGLVRKPEENKRSETTQPIILKRNKSKKYGKIAEKVDLKKEESESDIVSEIDLTEEKQEIEAVEEQLKENEIEVKEVESDSEKNEVSEKGNEGEVQKSEEKSQEDPVLPQQKSPENALTEDNKEKPEKSEDVASPDEERVAPEEESEEKRQENEVLSGDNESKSQETGIVSENETDVQRDKMIDKNEDVSSLREETVDDNCEKMDVDLDTENRLENEEVSKLSSPNENVDSICPMDTD